MAAISTSRRSASGIALIVAGAALLLSAVLPLVGFGAPWLTLIAYAALAVALVILAVGGVNNTIAKVALFVGGAGWLLLALAGLGVTLPAGITTAGAVFAGAGTLVGAIVLYAGKEIVNVSGLAFVISAILAAILMLTYLGVFSLGALNTLLVVAFGIALVITGLCFRRAERKR